MKIQLSQTRIIPDAMVVWSEHGPEVDMVMDLKNLSFAPGSVEMMFAFHVSDHLFPEEVASAMQNWRKCLAPGALLYLLVDDFEYICRGFVGGDLSIDLINDQYNHPTQFTRDAGAAYLRQAGFKDENISVWLVSEMPGLFKKKHYELVIQAKN